MCLCHLDLMGTHTSAWALHLQIQKRSHKGEYLQLI